MGFFESNPLAMIVVIIVTVEGWSLLKKCLGAVLAKRDTHATTSQRQE